jgi:phage shock protein A
MAVSTRSFDDFENEIEDFSDKEAAVPEASPSTKLARRRKIEDLFEEKRLKEELEEFG